MAINSDTDIELALIQLGKSEKNFYRLKFCFKDKI